MEIVFIRHGEPEWELDGLCFTNPPLTERGLQQAERLAKAMQNEHFDEVLVSPLVRARQTAAPLLEALGHHEVVDDWLEEIRSPSWHGTPVEKAVAAYDELKARPSEERWHGLDGGESIREFVTRIRRGAAGFLADRGVVRSDVQLPVWQIAEPGARIALVAHAGTNSVAIGHLLGLAPTPWEWDRFVLGHASGFLSRYQLMSNGFTFSLTKLSDLEHLDREDRTR